MTQKFTVLINLNSDERIGEKELSELILESLKPQHEPFLVKVEESPDAR